MATLVDTSLTLPLVSSTFELPKDGENTSEDRSHVYELPETKSVVIGLADGCSGSIGGGLWAYQLISALQKCIGKEDDSSLFERCQMEARSQYRPIGATQRERRMLENGDYAALIIAIIVQKGSEWEISLRSVGDTCAFLFEKGNGNRWFSGFSGEIFPSIPPLISSKGSVVGSRLPPQPHEATWQPISDRWLLLICSDEIARYILEMQGRGRFQSMMETLEDIFYNRNTDPAVIFKNELYDIRNDDVTIVATTPRILWDYNEQKTFARIFNEIEQCNSIAKLEKEGKQVSIVEPDRE